MQSGVPTLSGSDHGAKWAVTRGEAPSYGSHGLWTHNGTRHCRTQAVPVWMIDLLWRGGHVLVFGRFVASVPVVPL